MTSPTGVGAFTKHRGRAPRGALQWEAAGLAWLAEATASGGARVVDVLDVDDDRLVEPRLASVAPSRRAAEDFGRSLALTHLSGATSFGTPPEGWSGDGYIGPLPLPTPSVDGSLAWGAFHTEYRVLPFARSAFDAGSLSSQALATIEHVCDRLVAGEFDDGRPPARIHGDLWAGNVMWTSSGVMLVDPAAHGGHAEADLAMLELFGAPHLATIAAAWAEAYRPPADWRDRIALHQLHPVLVHAVLFGGGYGEQAGRLAARFC